MSLYHPARTVKALDSSCPRQAVQIILFMKEVARKRSSWTRSTLAASNPPRRRQKRYLTQARTAEYNKFYFSIFSVKNVLYSIVFNNKRTALSTFYLYVFVRNINFCPILDTEPFLCSFERCRLVLVF
jgi:hypothetical protein